MKSRLKATLLSCLAMFVGAGLLCFATEHVAKAVFGVELPVQDQVEFVRRHMGWNATFAILLLQIVAIMPALEEILFRGLLWKLPLSLARRWSGPRGAGARGVSACLVSAAFAFVHYIDYSRLIGGRGFSLVGWNSAFLALFFVGMAQCWLYRKTDALWCPVANHALFNVLNTAMILLVSP